MTNQEALQRLQRIVKQHPKDQYLPRLLNHCVIAHFITSGNDPADAELVAHVEKVEREFRNVN